MLGAAVLFISSGVVQAPEAAPLAAINVPSDLQTRTIRLRKRIATAVRLEAGQSITFMAPQAGELQLLVHQPLRGRKASRKVRLQTEAEGKTRTLVFAGIRDRFAKTETGERLAKVKTHRQPIAAAGQMRIVSQAQSAPAYVEMRFYPRGGAAFVPLQMVPVAPPVVQTPAPEAAGAPEEEFLSAVAQAEAKVRAGDVRDLLIGAFTPLQVRRGDGPEIQCHRATIERPFHFVVRGPGVVTLRLYGLFAAAQNALPTLTIMENDVLFQTVTVGSDLSKGYSAVGVTGVEVAAPREYHLTLGESVSRFEIIVADSAPNGVALHYDFAARAATDNADFATLLGEGLDRKTILTEVEVRETVIEKVVKVSGDSFLGVSAVASVTVPHWLGPPSVGGTLGLRIGLPVPNLSLIVEAGLQDQQLRANAGGDGVQHKTRTTILSVPLIVSLGATLYRATIVRLYGHVGGGLVFVDARRRDGLARIGASTFSPAARATVGVEISLGAGALIAEGGYLYTLAAPDLDPVVRDYRGTGYPVSLGYRLGF